MSPACVTKLLRDQLGFKGLIFTDALTMKGATQALQGSACVNALLAGNDVLLMPGDVKAELDAIMAAVDAGTLTQEAIDDHCRRLLRYKYAFGDCAKCSILPLCAIIQVTYIIITNKNRHCDEKSL